MKGSVLDYEAAIYISLQSISLQGRICYFIAAAAAAAAAAALCILLEMHESN
jgi:hypothetical protein